MTRKQNMTLTIVAAALSTLVAANALAQGVGNLPLPSHFETGVPASGWTVIDPSGLPIPVELDPTGPFWRKEFTGPQGQPFSQPAFGPPLPVTEVLIVAGNLPWTDWHETVLHPDWTWANPQILINGSPASNLVTVISGNSVDFYFDPVYPGSLVTIKKDLIYNGVPGATFYGKLQIIEYPTPEPATAGLSSAAGLLLVRRRVRRG